MKAKIEEMMGGLQGIHQQIQQHYHQGIIDGFDEKFLSQICLWIFLKEHMLIVYAAFDYHPGVSKWFPSQRSEKKFGELYDDAHTRPCSYQQLEICDKPAMAEFNNTVTVRVDAFFYRLQGPWKLWAWKGG